MRRDRGDGEAGRPLHRAAFGRQDLFSRFGRVPHSGTALTDTITVALIGNPNTGKLTLFSALVGMRQRVGNYPGVTVEEKIGRMEIHGRPYIVIDLPGTYSLAPRSPDEMIVVDVLLGRHVATGAPDVMLCIVRREQPGAQPLPVEPGARASPARGGRVEHGRHCRGEGDDVGCQLVAGAPWRSGSRDPSQPEDRLGGFEESSSRRGLGRMRASPQSVSGGIPARGGGVGAKTGGRWAASLA